MPARSRVVTTPERSHLMASVRQTGTSAELAVRRIVSRLGYVYATKATDLSGTPDIVSRGGKWAIFVNGCFWHAHSGCARWRIPKRNRAFWSRKFSENRRRDRRNIELLKKKGYSVLVVWECNLEDRKKLARTIGQFLAEQKLVQVRGVSPLGLDRRSHDPTFSAVRKKEGYEYSRSGKSVRRVVYLANGRKVLTCLRVSDSELGYEDPQSSFDYAFLRKHRITRQLGHLKTVRVVDLFCGCGGLSLGAMEACNATGKSFLPVAAVDIDPAALEVYKQNFPRCRSYCRDIFGLLDGDIGSRPTRNERVFLRKIGKVNMLLAGPPCQGYSDLNNHTRRDDTRNILYERVARFIEIVRPENILIENVPAAIHGRERAVQKSIDVIERLGYRVDSGTVDLAMIGVPQKRRRHVVIASTSKTLSIREVMKRYKVADTRSAWWAIGDLEDEPRVDLFSTPSQHTRQNMRRMKYLHENGVYHLPNRLRPSCHRHGNHTYRSMYGRLQSSEPAQTITSGFGSPGQGRFIHPTRPRTTTPHEAARLQFFPDSFDFSVVEKRTSLAQMIGNAAPMKLSYVFCLEFLS